MSFIYFGFVFCRVILGVCGRMNTHKYQIASLINETGAMSFHYCHFITLTNLHLAFSINDIVSRLRTGKSTSANTVPSRLLDLLPSPN